MIGRSVYPYVAVLLAAAILALLPLISGGYGLSVAIGTLNFAVLATAWGLFSGPTR